MASQSYGPYGLNGSLICLSILSTMLLLSCGRRMTKKILEMPRPPSACDRKLAAEINFTNIYQGYNSYDMNCSFYFPKKCDAMPMEIKVKKCPTLKEVDCEPVVSFPFPDVCIIEIGVKFKNSFVNFLDMHTQPPMKCPIQGFYSGKYTVREENQGNVIRFLQMDEENIYMMEVLGYCGGKGPASFCVIFTFKQRIVKSNN